MWAQGHEGKEASLRRRHPSRLMHPAILPELGATAGGPPVDDSYDLGPVDENVARKEFTVSEAELCICWKMAKQLLNVLRSTEFKEYATVVVKILLGARKCVWRVPMEGREPIVVGTSGTSVLSGVCKFGRERGSATP